MFYLVKTERSNEIVAVFFDFEVAEHYMLHQFTFMEDVVVIPVSRDKALEYFSAPQK